MRGLGFFCTLLAAAFSVASEAHAQSDPASCVAEGPLSYVCGAERPEDLARIPGTRWVIASGFAPGAGLKLVDAQNRTMRPWFVGGASQIDRNHRLYSDCRDPPMPTLFNARGLSLRSEGEGRATLHVVNHGGRESIEVFAVDTRGAIPTLRWRGCIMMPEGHVGNSVATFGDGTVLTTVLTRPGRTITDFVRGETTGAVYQWRPGARAFTLLEGTELPGNNGIETARDDSEFYVVAFGRREIVVFDRRDTSRPLRRAVAPNFMPDNIHWDSGRLITAGMVRDEPACGGVRKIVDGVADPMRCPRGYVVAELDPRSMEFRVVSYAEPTAHFNGVSAAVIVEDMLWLGSFRADRVAYRRLPDAVVTR